MYKKLEGVVPLVRPCLPILEFPHQEYSRCHQQLDSVSHQLHWSVWVIRNCLYLLALLDAPDKVFGSLGGTKRQAEESMIVEKLVSAQASIRKFELVEYVLNTHGQIPANEAGVGRHLEFVGNVVVQHFEACTVDVLVRRELRLVPFKEMLGNFDHHWHSKGWQRR
jgi:hypothetical protein